MSLDASRWAWQQDLKLSDKMLLLALADRASEDNTAWPSYARIQRDTGMHRNTIGGAIKRLVEAGLITKVKRYGTSTIYQLNGVPDRHSRTKNSTTHSSTKTSTTSSTKTSTGTYQGTYQKDNSVKKRFKEPTIQEIADYVSEKKYNVNAEQFWNHYEARGWELKQGQKMVKWKAAVATWNGNSSKFGGNVAPINARVIL